MAPQNFGTNAALNAYLAGQTGYTGDFGGGKFSEFLTANPQYNLGNLQTPFNQQGPAPTAAPYVSSNNRSGRIDNRTGRINSRSGRTNSRSG